MSKNFALLSFVPAIAYWYLEANYSLKIAVIGGMSLALLEVVIEKIFLKHVHEISKLNFFLLFILGPISLINEDGIWFKLQPFFTGVAMFLFLALKMKRGKSLFKEMMEEMGKQIHNEQFLVMIEKHLAYFFLIYGCFMGSLAVWSTTSIWAFFKTIGLYIAFALFMVGEVVYIKLRVKKIQ